MHLKTLVLSMAAVALASGFACAPAFAAETISATFTTPDGGVTTGTYDDTVRVTVSGVGHSLGTDFNDAFYLYDPESPPVNDPNFYQLTFGTSTLVGLDPAQDAKNFLVGPLPAFNPNHVYTFDLNTGATSPTQLHFGVSDGDFADNSGAFTITVAQLVPEPAAWALMLAGLGLAGAGLRLGRRERAAPTAA